MTVIMLISWLAVVVGSLFASEFALKKLNLLD